MEKLEGLETEENKEYAIAFINFVRLVLRHFLFSKELGGIWSNEA